MRSRDCAICWDGLDGEPFSVGGITVQDGKIVAIDILADPERLRRVDLTMLDN